MSTLYGLIIAADLVNSVESMASITYMKMSIQNAFFIFFIVCTFLAACLHPRDVLYLLALPIYMLLTPAMSMLLIVYAIINMNLIAWGVRDPSSSPMNSTHAENSVDATAVIIKFLYIRFLHYCLISMNQNTLTAVYFVRLSKSNML